MGDLWALKGLIEEGVYFSPSLYIHHACFCLFSCWLQFFFLIIKEENLLEKEGNRCTKGWSNDYHVKLLQID